MDVRAWNDLEELLARLVLEEAFELEDAVVRIAALQSDENAEVLLLAGITVQSDLLLILGIEDQAALVRSHRRYQVLACLAADVALLPAYDRTCRALCRFWKSSGSPVFRVS